MWSVGTKGRINMLGNGLSLLLCVILGTYVPANYATQGEPSPTNIQIIREAEEMGPGPLDRRSISIAGIYLDDTQEEVLKKLGEPTEKGIEHSTPFPQWYYKDLNMYVSFFSDGSSDEKVGGVVRISVTAPTDKEKTKTNYGFGIGDKVSSFEKRFPKIYAYNPHEDPETHEILQAFYITGKETFHITYTHYRPSFWIGTVNGVIEGMELTTE
jgi:hypothetical protein